MWICSPHCYLQICLTIWLTTPFTVLEPVSLRRWFFTGWLDKAVSSSSFILLVIPIANISTPLDFIMSACCFTNSKPIPLNPSVTTTVTCFASATNWRTGIEIPSEQNLMHGGVSFGCPKMYLLLRYYATRLPDFIQSEVKPKSIVARWHTFSRVLLQLHVLSSSCYWFTWFSASFEIGYSDYFAFSLKTLMIETTLLG